MPRRGGPATRGFKDVKIAARFGGTSSILLRNGESYGQDMAEMATGFIRINSAM